MRFIDWITQSVGDLPEPTPGREWVWLVAMLIGASPGMLGAFWARQAKSEGKATNRQVVNGHGEEPVLRADIDKKHAELMAEMSGVKAVLHEHGGRLESIEEHLRN